MNRSKKFASQADLEEKQISFTKLSEHAYAYTAEGDPNTGIIIGDDAVLVADAAGGRATRHVDRACGGAGGLGQFRAHHHPDD
jgi:hypothetical protein